MLGEEALLTRLALWAGAPVALPIQYARQDAESLFSPHTKRLAFRMAGLGARGVSSEQVENMENAEKMENMEMLSGSPLRCSLVLQLRCALVLGEPCSGSRRTVLWFSENHVP